MLKFVKESVSGTLVGLGVFFCFENFETFPEKKSKIFMHHDQAD